LGIASHCIASHCIASCVAMGSLERERLLREAAEREADAARSVLAQVRAENVNLQRAREDLAIQLKYERDALEDSEDAQVKLQEEVLAVQRRMEEMRARHGDAEEARRELARVKGQLADLERQEASAVAPSHANLGEDSSAMLRQHELNNGILLDEVEAQSLEIEKLFRENGRLSLRIDEACLERESWQEQCRSLAQQNERLQEMLIESANWATVASDQEQRQATAPEASAPEASAPRQGQNGDGHGTGTGAAVEAMHLRAEVLRFEKLYREEQALRAKLANALSQAELGRMETREKGRDVEHDVFVPVIAAIEARLLKVMMKMKNNAGVVSKGRQPI